MDTPLLEVKDVSYAYHTKSGETPALSHISFSVEKGEFLAIVGPSGCGKSTLLDMLCGLLTPEEGEILLNGKPLSESVTNIGYMLQKDHLFEWRTIYSNVLLGLEIQKKNSPNAREKVNHLLADYGLDKFRESRPSQLSGGMRQRAALIRTLAPAPALLLLDEAFSALDYQTRLSVTNDIYSILRGEQATAILVTHDISEAVALSDRVVVLSARPAVVKAVHTIEMGGQSPQERRDDPRFREYFNTIWKELDLV